MRYRRKRSVIYGGRLVRRDTGTPADELRSDLTPAGEASTGGALCLGDQTQFLETCLDRTDRAAMRLSQDSGRITALECGDQPRLLVRGPILPYIAR